MSGSAVLSDTQRLRRVLEQELGRDCDNAIVIGGLDRMFAQMRDDGLLNPRHPLSSAVSSLGESGYRSLPVCERASWLRSAIAALQATPARAIYRPAQKPTARPTAPGPSRGTPARAVHPVVPPLAASPAGGRLEPGDSVTKLPGVGPANASRFARLGVATVGDAAGFFPRRFNDFTDLRTIAELRPTGHPQTFTGTVFSLHEVRRGRNVMRAEAVVIDSTGSIRVVWFRPRGIRARLPEGEQFVFSGKPEAYRGRLQVSHPEFEPIDADSIRTGRLVPVYAATDGLSQLTIRRAVKAAVDAIAEQLVDPVPAVLLRRRQLPPMAQAVRDYHYPRSLDEAEQARRRLAIGEFLAIQAAVLTRRARWQRHSDAPPLSLGPALERFLAALPFTLTPPQNDSLDDILADISQPIPMLRLLQGDVGSGKTVVAFAAMLAAVVSGKQAALMAPTEILAEQHYRSLAKLLGDQSALDAVFAPEWLGRPVRALLLTGSLTPSQKEQVRADASHGGADIIIGTHALLEAGVQLPRLGLAVVDEQHRFGVAQREKLRQKGTNPHLLVMTATPIPRTLALTVYGDLEVSSIDQLPPGRKPIKTMWVQPHERGEAYDFLRERLGTGEQAFVICPLVEESETLDARSAEEEYERLRTGPLANYRLELLHGRMAGKQKDEIMGRFGRKDADVLVSTSVIEVGIDIPNATVIVIEGAERFGLSQLHQFRGRVGRSEKQSWCMLFSTDEEPGPDATERLQAMCQTNDGFRLAEVDLELRGEGEAWGRIQSGQNTMLRVARLTDRDLLLEAREMAAEVLERDPDLQLAENRSLAAAVKPFLEKAAEAN